MRLICIPFGTTVYTGRSVSDALQAFVIDATSQLFKMTVNGSSRMCSSLHPHVSGIIFVPGGKMISSFFDNNLAHPNHLMSSMLFRLG